MSIEEATIETLRRWGHILLWVSIILPAPGCIGSWSSVLCRAPGETTVWPHHIGGDSASKAGYIHRTDRAGEAKREDRTSSAVTRAADGNDSDPEAAEGATSCLCLSIDGW